MSGIEEIKRDLNIESFEKLTNEQMHNLMTMAGKGKISVEQLKQIATMVPHFTELAVKSAEALYKVAASAADSQDKAFSALTDAMDRLERLTSHPKADKDTLALVVEKIAEIAKSVERLNTSNNSFFGGALKVLGGISVVCLTIVGLAFAVDSTSSKA